MRALAALLLMAVVAMACGDEGDAAGGTTVAPGQSVETSNAGSPAASASPITGTPAVDYASDANWLCRPAKSDDLCAGPFTATVLQRDRTTQQSNIVPLRSAPIDCFYVYPTVSTDSGVNSDLEPGTAERGVILAQAAPFVQSCKVYAPLYRQVTVTALLSGRFGDPKAGAIAYGDVVAAWQHYLANDNNGRKVVLIGHSQGAMVLKRLITEHIDSAPAVRDRMAAAFLLGTAVSVPAGQDVGGDFKNIPACRSAKQQGCVLSYASFNTASPPPPGSLFGRVVGSGNQALCVDPAALSSGALSVWLPASSFRSTSTANPAAALNPQTTYVVYEGLGNSACVKDGAFSYLGVSLNADGKAWGLTLPPYFTGEVWGLHNIDVSLALGNLVELVRGYGN